MRKFTIISRKGTTTLQEVEVEILSPIDDPSVMWLGKGEYKARILAPESLHQKVEREVNGKKEIVLVPDVWCWHAFYDSEEAARAKAEKEIQTEFERQARKSHTELDVVACLAKCKEIQVAKL